MSQYSVLAINDDLPIKTSQPIHSGKVRSVYWLTDEDSKRLIYEQQYDVAPDASLGVMVISDRVSAFECIWQGEGGLMGVPGKGAALNAISNYWFQCFKEKKLADNHILDMPHPMVWIVQRAKPVMIEAIARKYITGSMWRSYAKGERNFCGEKLPDNFKKNQALSGLLITPSTKGILKGVSGVLEIDDVNISRKDIENNYKSFCFQSLQDIDRYERLLIEGFNLIHDQLNQIGEIFVDTKFEFGYVYDANGREKLIYMDEVGTPDSSRIWSKEEYLQGKVIEHSKEGFRQALLNFISDPDILLNKNRTKERKLLAKTITLPQEVIMDVSKNYADIAFRILGETFSPSENTKESILDILNQNYGIVQ